MRSRDGRGPLRANPHMHLLEAALAWLPIDPEPIWRRSADMIAALCLDRFMDGESGVLRERFSTDWTPLPGPEGQMSSRVTITNGHFCSIVGLCLPTGNGQRRWRILSLLLTATASIEAATWPSMRLGRMDIFTIRSRGCGRRPNVSARILLTTKRTAMRACNRRSPRCGVTSTRRSQGFGMKIRPLTVSS